MSSLRNRLANKVLRELYCDIIEQVNVDEVSSRFYSKYRITLAELNKLRNISYTDEDKKHTLYSVALAEKGEQALDAFLEVLDETSGHYKPHALLARRVREKCKEHEYFERDGRHKGNIKLISYKSVPENLLESKRVVTHHPQLLTASSLPETSSGYTPHAIAPIPGPNDVVTSSPSNITDPSHVPALLNDSVEDSSRGQEVVTDGGLVDKKFHKSVDEGLGSSTVTIHNPLAIDDVTNHQYSNGEQSPMFASADHHLGNTANGASKVTKGRVHKSDSVPRPGRLLERSAHSLCKMVPIKLILLGNSGVGKTSLMYRFLKGDYDELSPSTIGGIRSNCYLTYTAKKVNIELAIWDTAGQERFHCISPSFYRRVDVVIMVFDMTDNESRTSLHAVEDWKSQLVYCSGRQDIPVILAGNKCKSLAVSRTIGKHAEHVVKKLGFDSFMEVAAKENYQVEALFAKAIELALIQKTADNDPNVIRVTPSPPYQKKSGKRCK